MPASVPPDCVTPAQIFFALSGQAAHQQTVSLCNPFKFPVRYKAYITDPNRYNVVFPEGSLPPLGRCSVVVHLVKSAASSAVRRASETQIDKFKFCFYRKSDDRPVGECTIQAVLSKHASRKPVELSAQVAAAGDCGGAPSTMPTAVHRGLPNVFSTATNQVAGSTGISSHLLLSDTTGTSAASAGAMRPNASAVLVGILALCVLCLPSEGELFEMIPSVIRPNALQRQLAAFVLGMVIVALLRW